MTENLSFVDCHQQSPSILRAWRNILKVKPVNHEQEFTQAADPGGSNQHLEKPSSMSGVRLDRLATVYFHWPVSRMFRNRRKMRIPILMYHALQEGSSDPRPYFETNISPQVFASQVRQLQSLGYRAVGLGQALQALGKGAYDPKIVVITFDDGYRDFYEIAFPALSECHFTATVFLMTGYMGDQAAQFKGKRCLTWKQVRELHSLGISFGSHTVMHPQLRSLDTKHAEQELASSKKTIEDQLGTAIGSFSYPYAFPEAEHEFRRRLRDLLVKHGYENGVTTILGTAHPRCDRFCLPRLPVNNWDDPRFFQAKLEGGYDWLHGAQYLFKAIKRFRPWAAAMG